MMAQHPQDAIETPEPLLKTANAHVNTDALERPRRPTKTPETLLRQCVFYARRFLPILTM